MFALEGFVFISASVSAREQSKWKKATIPTMFAVIAMNSEFLYNVYDSSICRAVSVTIVRLFIN